MENQQSQNFGRDDEQQMLAEILENSRKTKNYMKWQLIITVGLVVIPLIGALVMIPIALNSIGSLYGIGASETGVQIDAGTISELQQLIK
jgi:hypothetical protein